MCKAAGSELVRNEPHVHDAVHAIEVTIEQRHARMRRFANLPADLVPAGRDVDAVYFAARHHHVLDPAPFEPEQRLDHALALGRLRDECIGEILDGFAGIAGDHPRQGRGAAVRGKMARRAT